MRVQADEEMIMSGETAHFGSTDYGKGKKPLRFRPETDLMMLNPDV